ncbi:MAG: hypothetical protein Kow0089_23930 [Desulfobulbaceae bacterium]
MADTSFWDERRGVIHARKGGWVIGEAVYNQGYSMMDDLVGKSSWMQVIILNVTGRLPERRLADWLEAAFVCMSWPDSRIWCNQIGSLAGTMQATGLAGVCAGILATDSTMYGLAPLLESTSFLRQALEKRKKGFTVEEILREHQRRPDSVPVIVGFIRPIATGDERLEPLKQLADRLGFEKGEHLALAFEIEQVMREKFNEGMNINAYVAAFLCDQGYSSLEVYRMCTLGASAGVLACHDEAAGNPPGSFFPLQCEDIRYGGPPPRSVPEKNTSE